MISLLFAHSLFFLKAGDLVVMKCDIVWRTSSLKCARVFIDFGQGKIMSSSSFHKEEPCSSLTITFFWLVSQPSDNDAARRPLLTNSACHFVVLVNFPRMEDDFPSSEQDFEDNDDPGWYANGHGHCPYARGQFSCDSLCFSIRCSDYSQISTLVLLRARTHLRTYIEVMA